MALLFPDTYMDDMPPGRGRGRSPARLAVLLGLALAMASMVFTFTRTSLVLTFARAPAEPRAQQRDGELLPTTTSPPPSPPPRLPRVLFLVTPSSVNEERYPARAHAIMDTWGKGQRVRFAARNASPFPHGVVWVMPGRMADRSMAQWRWMLSRALGLREGDEEDTWDWVAKCDDLTYFIPGNLAAFLSTRDDREPDYLGDRLQADWGAKPVFASGVHVVMPHASVEMLVRGWCKGFADNHPPDLFAASCHEQLSGRAASDTRAPGGGARFSVYGPARLAKGDVDSWYNTYKELVGERIVPGTGCCARDFVAFHYVEAGEARAIHTVLGDQERWRSAAHDERGALWPAARELVYSARVEGGDEVAWDLLTRHIQVAG